LSQKIKHNRLDDIIYTSQIKPLVNNDIILQTKAGKEKILNKEFSKNEIVELL
jgi:hypothetical protein